MKAIYSLNLELENEKISAKLNYGEGLDSFVRAIEEMVGDKELALGLVSEIEAGVDNVVSNFLLSLSIEMANKNSRS